MKTKVFIILLHFCTSIFRQCIVEHLNHIEGHWAGTLTYTDYQDDIKQSTLNCQMKSKWKGNRGTLSLGFKEPNGNVVYGKTKIKVYSNNTKVKFDGSDYNVESFSTDDDTGEWRLVIKTQGKDNRKPASIRQSIIYDGINLSLKKEVKYQDGREYFIRNQYKFQRS